MFLPQKKTAVSVYPWKSMLTSVPVLAVCVADFSLLWILYLFTTNLPIYLKGVLRFDIREVIFSDIIFMSRTSLFGGFKNYCVWGGGGLGVQ